MFASRVAQCNRSIIAAGVLAAALPFVTAQAPESANNGLYGYVRDTNGRPVPNAAVILEPVSASHADSTEIQITHTDSLGVYRFALGRGGTYTIRAELSGYATTNVGTVDLNPNEAKRVDIALGRPGTAPANAPANASPAKKKDGSVPEFFDEPQFTVAGVTEAANSGGHGSERALRTTEALARETVSLGKESAERASPSTERTLREAVARQPEDFEANRQLGKFLLREGETAEALPYIEHAARLSASNPEAHFLLGEAAEKQGDPLKAVREYQRAGELDPSEENLFAWGTELLAHGAPEPAAEVFAKGNRLFPESARMLVALGVAWYARGSYDDAAKYLISASDLAPGNPVPYLFLGKVQSAGMTTREDVAERLARFADLQPNNALANYYYAVSLWKQSESGSSGGVGLSTHIESLLTKATHLNPKLGEAYLQLGILYAQRGDFAHAIAEYQKAIEVGSGVSSLRGASPEPNEVLGQSHYRLAQAYMKVGDDAKAKVEFEIHNQLLKKNKDDSDRRQRGLQQFIISLRDKD